MKRLIESHTAIRGIAALSVVAYHLQFGGGYHLPFETVTPIFRRSYLFVDLFFILSGFIISYANRAERTIPYTGRQYRDFLIFRFARIYPLHALCLLAFAAEWAIGSVVMAALHHQPFEKPGPASEFAIQLALLNTIIGDPNTWNIPSWSISAEVFAYVLFPLVVGVGIWSRSVMFVLLGAGAIVFYGTVGITTGNLDIISGLAPARCLAGFAAGMLIYFLRNRIDAMGVTALSIAQATATVWTAFVLIFGANDVLIIPSFAALVASTWTDRGVLPVALRRRWSMKLGEISYSIYLVHSVVLYVFSWRRIDPLTVTHPAAWRAAYLLFAFGLVIAVAGITYRYVEIPARRWLGRALVDQRLALIEAAPAAP